MERQWEFRYALPRPPEGGLVELSPAEAEKMLLKNRGIALAGQGNFREAAQCFVTATRVNASDRRSFDLLTKLLAEHPELEFEFAVDVECCRQAVGVAAGEMEKLKPIVHRGFKKRLLLLRMKLQSWFRRQVRLGRRRNTGQGYSEFLVWSFQGDLAAYYADLRWPGWQDEIGTVGGDQALSIYPPFWADGPPVGQRSRGPISIAEIYDLHVGR